MKRNPHLVRVGFFKHSDPNLQFFAALAPMLLALILFWPFGGGQKVPMVAGTQTPAAHGTVTVHNGSNNNAKVDLKVEGLAKPSSLTPPANAYVVWIQPPGQPAQNQGEVKVDKNLNGQLHTDTPYKRFKLFITAEQNAQVQSPTGPQVLTADVAES
jgi:hypothetical protein